MQLSQPERIGPIEGHFAIQYGPSCLRPPMLQHMALGIAQIAEAERHLESLLDGFVSGTPAAVSVLMSSFRGHRNLLGVLEACYRETGSDAAADTLAALKNWPGVGKEGPTRPCDLGQL